MSRQSPRRSASFDNPIRTLLQEAVTLSRPVYHKDNVGFTSPVTGGDLDALIAMIVLLCPNIWQLRIWNPDLSDVLPFRRVLLPVPKSNVGRTPPPTILTIFNHIATQIFGMPGSISTTQGPPQVLQKLRIIVIETSDRSNLHHFRDGLGSILNIASFDFVNIRGLFAGLLEAYTIGGKPADREQQFPNITTLELPECRTPGESIAAVLKYFPKEL